jgi:hypothetical protein
MDPSQSQSQSQSKTTIYNDTLYRYEGDDAQNSSLINTLLNLAIEIYTDGPKEGLECGINMVRVLDSIKRYNNVFNNITYDNDLIKIIQDAVITGCDSDGKSTDFSNVINDLANLKKENKDDALFKKYVDEILEAKSNPDNPGKFKFVLHSGFKQRILGMRLGPSPKSSDEEGVFICNLGLLIAKFLQYYNIKFTKSKRYDELNRQCLNALLELIPFSKTLSTIKKIESPNAPPPSSLMLSGPQYNKYIDLSKQATANFANGGRSSRRRKAYKTTRRKNKNKKQYRRKRHTKRCKKSHRRSRR